MRRTELIEDETGHDERHYKGIPIDFRKGRVPDKTS